MARPSSSSFHDLPADLFTAIFLWLPVKSLLRFRSVSKNWRSLIDEDNREFVAEHHQRSKDCLFVRTFQISSVKFSFSLFTRKTQRVIIPELDTSYFHIKYPALCCLSGPCNGVFCIYYHYLDRYNTFLWNPATRKIRTLPERELKFPGDQTSGMYTMCYSVEFGFDAKTNDYKVAILCVGHLFDGKKKVLYALVYRLSSDSWQVIHLVNASQQILNNVSVNSGNGNMGMILSLAEDTDSRLMMVSFDFSDETTTATFLPDDYNRLSPEDDDYAFMGFMRIHKEARNLFVLDGRIALVNQLRPKQPDHYEIWVLNEIGNRESWTNLYKFGPCPDLKLPRGNLKRHELFTESESGELIWCYPVNPIGLVYRSIKSNLWVYSYAYKESLVTID